MTESQLDLARRLVAHPKWRWVAGMLAVGEFSTVRIDIEKEGRPIRVESHRSFADDGTYSPVHVYANHEAVPALDDFATAAILLRMAIEAGMDVNDGSKWGRWQNLPGTAEWFFVEGDPGTVAAQALLAACG